MELISWSGLPSETNSRCFLDPERCHCLSEGTQREARCAGSYQLTINHRKRGSSCQAQITRRIHWAQSTEEFTVTTYTQESTQLMVSAKLAVGKHQWNSPEGLDLVSCGNTVTPNWWHILFRLPAQPVLSLQLLQTTGPCGIIYNFHSSNKWSNTV